MVDVMDGGSGCSRCVLRHLPEPTCMQFKSRPYPQEDIDNSRATWGTLQATHSWYVPFENSKTRAVVRHP
jgi:hypothetical protein